jgi:hypothetical protein
MGKFTSGILDTESGLDFQIPGVPPGAEGGTQEPWMKIKSAAPGDGRDSSQNHSFEAEASGQAVESLASIEQTRTVQREKTKRTILISVCFLFSTAALVAVFAPAGRERVALAVSGAMVILAAGIVGFRNIIFKAPAFTASTSNSRVDPKTSQVR